MRKIFNGVAVALATPLQNNNIDFDSLAKLLKRCENGGIKTFVILATTGEGVTVKSNEREKIIRFVKDNVSRDCKIIVGTGSNNFETCYKNTIQAKSLHADGALVVTPYYNKTSQHGIVEFYNRLAELEFPMIVYNVPSRTGLNIELSTIERLIDNDYVYGIKESTCDINRIIKLHSLCKNKIAVYSGEDKLNYLFYCLGGDGAISVSANVSPKRTQDIFDLAEQNNYMEALEKQREIDELNGLLFCEVNPVPVKFMLEKIDIIKSSQVRLPLVELEKENKQKIENFIKNTIKTGIFQ